MRTCPRKLSVKMRCGQMDKRQQTQNNVGVAYPTVFRSTKVSASGTIGKRERFCADDSGKYSEFGGEAPLREVVIYMVVW